MTVPDGETTKSRKSPKTTLGNDKLQDRELESTVVRANDASPPFTDQEALTFILKTAVAGVDNSGINAGFLSKTRRQGSEVQEQLAPT